MNEDIKNNLPEVIPEEIDDNGDLPSSSSPLSIKKIFWAIICLFYV